MNITIKVTEQDIAQHNATEQDFQEIIKANFGNEKGVSSWLREIAGQILGYDIFQDEEENPFELPGHQGKAVFEVTFSLQSILRKIKVWFLREAPEEWQEAQAKITGHVESGKFLQGLEMHFWDVIQGGV